MEALNAAGRNEEPTGFIHGITYDRLGLFDSCCFACFSKVFVAGFSITCSVRFYDVFIGSPWPYNRGQFGVVGDQDGQVIAGQ